jgi:TRAP-type C4-dicarboxylate transport system permease small subunit
MRRLQNLLVWCAGGALLLAMLTDALAMLGRQLHVPLLGAIEIVQVAVLVAASGALLVAAWLGSHARVHLLVDRLPGRARAIVERVHALCGALLYLALLVGSAWMASDLWHGYEHSELLRLPYRPLRVLVVVTLLILVLHALRRAWRGGAR